jgi:signal transduction histidine kinase
METAIHRRTIALATVAHELKTPLAIIAGYVELLLGQKAGPLNDRQRRILEESQGSCERLQKFIQEFLVYSNLEAGEVNLKLEVGDLNACLSEVCGFYLEKFAAKGVALYFPVNPRLEPFAFDWFKVQQVASNLLENALKFTPRGGTVWLTAEPHMWDRRSRKDSLLGPERRVGSGVVVNAARVTVADTGIGIAPEYHQEVFDDFFKVPGQDDRSGGSGLGLAIARRLVHAHGGKIWVESEPRAGSKFCFLLPLQAGAA